MMDAPNNALHLAVGAMVTVVVAPTKGEHEW